MILALFLSVTRYQLVLTIYLLSSLLTPARIFCRQRLSMKKLPFNTPEKMEAHDHLDLGHLKNDT